MNGFTVESRFDALSSMVGWTPLLAIHLNYRGARRVLYAKAEHYNLTGSIKDRMALNVLRQAYAAGTLKPGDLIAEATSGNAGISIAAAGRLLGHPVHIYMPDWMSEERKKILRSLGAELHLVSRAEGGFLGAIAATQALQRRQSNVFLTCQFSNEHNSEAHELTTGPEILCQLASVGLAPEAFVAGVGTGGTVMGVGRALRREHPALRIYPLEPEESPTLSTGHKIGTHRIQGVSDDFIPEIVKLDEVDGVLSASDGDAIIMAQRLASELGLAVGISSGANLIGALKAQDLIGPTAVVVTVFSDDNKKYLSTDLSGVEPVKPGYRAPQVELLGYQVIGFGAQSTFGERSVPRGSVRAGAPRVLEKANIG
jgi:cysteine synthase A